MNGQNEHMMNEEDIGSGEKTPGQQDTEKIIEQAGEKKPDVSSRKPDAPEPGREEEKGGKA